MRKNEFPDLDSITRNISKEETISLDVLMNPSFMHRYTKASSFDEFLKLGGFDIHSEEDFKSIPDDVFNRHVKAFSSFSSWEEMQNAALDEYMDSLLNL